MWEEGKKLLSNSIILTAQLGERKYRYKSDGIKHETLSSTGFSANMNHITWITFVGLGQPAVAAAKPSTK